MQGQMVTRAVIGVFLCGAVALMLGIMLADPTVDISNGAHASLGTVQAGKHYETEFTATNRHAYTVRLTPLIHDMCACTTVTVMPPVVSPGQKAQIHVALDPDDVANEITMSRTLFVESAGLGHRREQALIIDYTTVPTPTSRHPRPAHTPLRTKLR